MGLDPQTQGDARTKQHADVCSGYLPTELANEEERKMGCAECLRLVVRQNTVRPRNQ
jgi:hypothetical protein